MFDFNDPTKKHRSLIVWDTVGSAPVGDWTTLLWSSFVKSDDLNSISIPEFVEEHADALRSRYLAWLNELGEINISGKRIVDHLEIRPGLSYWWMTLLAEKSIYKSPRIFDALRFFALEEVQKKIQPSRIILISSNQAAALTFKSLCRKSNIQFEWKRSKQPENRLSIKKRIIRFIPLPIQAFLYLFRYLAERWRLKKSTNLKAGISDARISFFDYLIHLDQAAIRKGHFASNYWTDLVNIFSQAIIGVNWFHIYVPHTAVKSATEAQELIDRFTKNSEGTQVHSILENALSFSVIGSCINDYLHIAIKGIRLGRAREHFRIAGSKLDLWPLFKDDWRYSLYGTTTMWNCLTINLFEKSIGALPKQEKGFYLLENQGWEMALINAWRAAGHGELIGVVHATVRYWDLRYFYDTKNYSQTGKNARPMPDLVALNGPAAIRAYHQSNYPKKQMVEVEALRYLYLENCDKKRSGAKSAKTLNILVCGDFLPETSRQMIKWLETASVTLPSYTKFIVKPHPACDILASDYPSLHLTMTDTPLSELFKECDVAFTSNSTSAAVDAYASGIPVIQVWDGSTFNFSPLRGFKGVAYVSNPKELAEALCHANMSGSTVIEPYFHIDRKLKEWMKLLEIDSRNIERN